MDQAKRVAKNTGILYGRLAITVFISLYTTRLVLKALGVDNFGIFNVVGGAIAMLTFLNAAMASATQRYMSIAQGEGSPVKQKKIFNVSVLLHLVSGFIIVLLLEGVGYFLLGGLLQIDPNKLFAARLIYQFMVVSTFFTIISVPYDAVLNAHENMFFVAVMGVVESFLKLGTAIYITYTSHDKLIFYGLLTACISILLMGVQRIYCHSKYEEVVVNPIKLYDKKLFREMTRFAGWSFLGTSSSMLSNYGQGVVLNMFFGTTVNAAQGVANQISGQLSVFATTMMKALNPAIAKNEGAGNRSKMIKATLMGSKVSFFLLMFFFIPVILELPYLFKFWLKEVPEYAVIFCRLILIRILIEQPFQPLMASIAAVGNIRKFQIYSSILNFIPLIASYILFKLGFKPYLNYIVFIVYAITSSILALFFSKRYCGLSLIHFFSEVLSRCYISFGITLILAAIPCMLVESSLIRLAMVLASSMILFFITVWFIGFSTKDRQEIWQIVCSIIPIKIS